MTQLQILRRLLQAGYSVEMHKLDDGYHVVVTGLDQAGAPARWESVDTRLDQAVNRLMSLPAPAAAPQQP